MPKERLYAAERDCLWHPFTQMKEWTVGPPVVIERADGCTLVDVEGREYLDGVSSLWCNVHGHNHPMINAAIRAQLGKVSHSTLLGLGSAPAAAFAGELIDVAPAGLTRVFYSDSGSTAVEVALKMAFQYWQQEAGDAHRDRKRFLCLTNAYHGDTVGAVSVGGIELFHKMFSPLLFESYHAPSPYCYRCPLGLRSEACAMECFDELATLAERHADDIAAVIVEPIVQGAAGMITAPPGYLRRVRELCDRLELLLIVDEVATGFGRTGTLFACEHEGIIPDLMALAKGISGGYLPLAATLTSERVYEAFLGEFQDQRTFFHGHTYTGNALACAAASASLRLFATDNVLASVDEMAAHLARGLETVAAHGHVGDVRQRGLMVGIELVADRTSKRPFPWQERRGARVCNRAMEKGVFIRPLGDVVVLMPPLAISEKEIDRLTTVVAECLGEVLG
ncbi:MAG: adenosylmethionine--8-amino-7-oxononanoate transaminase [Nitrospirota bacterium]|jgi:adenosylmethionine-8-amino-7-oxononanoate aminotransferase